MAGLWMSCVLYLVTWHVQAHLHSWSQQTYLHVRHTMVCNDTSANITFSDEDRGVWTKLGSDKELVTDVEYELSNNNLSLAIRNVTDSQAGIYVCDVLDKDGGVVFHAVWGVNIDQHLYHDNLDKYRTSIIVGVITAACVLFLVVGIGLVDHFQYLTDEQKEERRSRKPGDLCTPQLEGRDNHGMVDDLDATEPVSYGAIKTPQASTRF